MLPQAVYGLSEWSGDAIGAAQLVGNPGCYAETSILLPLLPLIADGLLDAAAPVVSTSYSGLSGAGKRFIEKNNNLFYAINENMHSYKALGISIGLKLTGQLNAAASVTTDEDANWHVHFVPHLAPLLRVAFTAPSMLVSNRG